jgi:hypothetical protein
LFDMVEVCGSVASKNVKRERVPPVLLFLSQAANLHSS